MRASPRSGFTLIEILGAFFIMTVILTLVTGIFVDNGRQRAAALSLMKESLSAAGTLDQIADDLEGAIFLTDSSGGRPDDYAWRFQSDGSGESGARALRFVSQNAPMTNRAEHSSSWVEMAYFLEEDETDGLVLWRWVSARPPIEAHARLPAAGDEGTMRMAIGVHDFGLRFMDASGGWLDDWDSAFQPPMNALPIAVEINLTLTREARRGESKDGELTVPGPGHQRIVRIRMHPIDVAALIELGQPDGGAGDGCFTVEDCISQGDNDWYYDQLDQNCSGDADLCEALSDSGNTCWREIQSGYPAVADKAPASCSQGQP